MRSELIAVLILFLLLGGYLLAERDLSEGGLFDLEGNFSWANFNNLDYLNVCVIVLNDST